MRLKAELLDAGLPAAELGEGPVWDPQKKTLYWVDITGQRIHRCAPDGKAHAFCGTPSTVGFAVPGDKGGLVAGLKDGIYAIDFSSGDASVLIRPAPALSGNRFNDGKCDRRGRLWAGTMNVDPDHGTPTGALYRYDSRGLRLFEEGIFISNGLGWSPDNQTMYYTDTVRRVIWRYDYDESDGTPSNRRAFASFDGAGRPDGMTVDSAGRVYTALWPGWQVAVFTADGKPEGRIDLPVPQVSSCAFGGEDLKTLYITTAKIGMTESQLRNAPLAGCVFRVEMDIPGLPETVFQGGSIG